MRSRLFGGWRRRVGLAVAGLAVAALTAAGLDTGPAGAAPRPGPAAAAPAALAGAPAAGSGRSKLALVIMVNWAGLPADTITPTTLTNQVAGASTRFQQYSYQQFTGWTATVVGPLTINPPPLDPGGTCGWNFKSSIQTQAEQAARNAGLETLIEGSTFGFNAILFYFPRNAACSWTVDSLFPTGSRDLFDYQYLNGGSRIENVAQALGLTIVGDPARSLVCVDAAGRPTPLSANCQTVETDPYNVLGGASNSPSVINKFQAGWMTTHDPATNTDFSRFTTPDPNPNTPVTFTIKPLEEVYPAGLQSVVLLDGDKPLWLEFRQPVGVDRGMRPASDGVLIYRESQVCYLPGCVRQSNLLDMTPGVGGRTFNDAVLRPGLTWRNPVGHFQVTVNSVSPSGAQVTIMLVDP